LKAAFQRAVEDGLLPHNPWIGMKQLKHAARAWHLVTDEEFPNLLAACPDRRWRVIVSLAFHCGLRAGEITSLEWSDIDWKNGEIRISPKSQWQPKDYEARAVPMPACVAKELRALGARLVGRIVSNRSGRRKEDRMRNNLTRDFQRIRMRAGIPHTTLHDLRRAAITNWASAVSNPEAVRRWAGHSNISTTAAFYLTVRPEDASLAKAAADKRFAVRAS
jgi:integrase